MTYLEDAEAEWVKDKIRNAGGRRTVLLSHHQLFSASEDIGGQEFNTLLYKQRSDVLPKVDYWFWAHEHDLVVFKEHLGLKRGRCVGHGAFPVGNDEIPDTRQPGRACGQGIPARQRARLLFPRLRHDGDPGKRRQDFVLSGRSRNERLIQLLCDDLYYLVRMYRYQFGMASPRARRGLQEHEHILEAIAERDPEMAEILMHRHVRASRRNLENLLRT